MGNRAYQIPDQLRSGTTESQGRWQVPQMSGSTNLMTSTSQKWQNFFPLNIHHHHCHPWPITQHNTLQQEKLQLSHCTMKCSGRSQWNRPKCQLALHSNANLFLKTTGMSVVPLIKKMGSELTLGILTSKTYIPRRKGFFPGFCILTRWP